MVKRSAGILVYRRTHNQIEVLLTHFGGPLWKKKDQGAWSIPKGEVENEEKEFEAALRELKEETGITIDSTKSFIDLDTMLKMKSVIDSMNQQQNDPRTNLLKSLKPYLKPSRKEKVEQYIKLFSMGKVFEVLNPMGGDKKNDV